MFYPFERTFIQSGQTALMENSFPLGAVSHPSVPAMLLYESWVFPVVSVVKNSGSFTFTDKRLKSSQL